MNKNAFFSVYFLFFLTIIVLLFSFLYDSSEKIYAKTILENQKINVFYKEKFCVLALQKFSFLTRVEFKACRDKHE